MKRQVLPDSKVVSRRGPLVDRTNIMPRANSETERSSQKRDVPYSKSSHSNNKNAQNKGLVNRNKDTSKDNTVLSTKRVRKVPSRCPCCTHTSPVGSKNVPSNNKSVEQIESANKRVVESKMCHDNKFNLQCRVILDRVNIEELSKKPNNAQQTLDNEISVSKPSYKVQGKIIPIGHVVSKQLKVKLSKISSSVPAKSLRQQTQPNYAETTINTSTEATLPDTTQICATKVPVYRQNLANETTKKPDNLYEFDESDSDRSRGKKNRKRLAKNHNLPQKQARKARAKVNRKRPARKYNDIMQEVMQKVIEKMGHPPKTISTKTVPTDVVSAIPKLKISSETPKSAPNIILPQNKVTVSQVRECIEKIGSGKQSGSTIDINKVLLNISPGKINVQECVDIENESNSLGLDINETRPTKHVVNKEITIDKHEKQNLIDSNKENVRPERNISPNGTQVSEYIINESFSNEFEASLENIPPTQNLQPSEHIIDESFSDDDDNGNLSEPECLDDSFLDFDIVHSTPIKNTPKINVISDVLVGKTPNRTPKHNPWRFNQAVTRNPHFIILKTTALPCLKQDMVLDHNQVEKIEEHFSKTPRRVTPRKSPVQKSILDYVNSPERRNQENIPRASLFDYDDFSPIKGKLPQTLKDKAKRNILGPIQDNAANIAPFTSTPTSATVRPPFIRDENDDIENCFGFEDGTISMVRDRPSEAQPFRIKEYVKRQPKQVAASVEVVKEVLPVEEPFESQIANDGVEGQIFDDPENAFSITVPSKIYIRKPRRKRIKSVDVENEGEHHPKKRKKDMMTKAEEAALEDWAAKFNSMCREVEKYDLEIE